MIYISFNKVYSLFATLLQILQICYKQRLVSYHVRCILSTFLFTFFKHTDYTALFSAFITYFSLLFHRFLSLFFTIAHHCYDQTYRNPDSCYNCNNIWRPVISAADLYKVSGKQFSLQAVHKGKSTGREDTS